MPAGAAKFVRRVRASSERPSRRIGEYYTVCLYSFARRLHDDDVANAIRQMTSVRRRRARLVQREIDSMPAQMCGQRTLKKKNPVEHRVRMAVPHSPRAKADRPLATRHLSPRGGRMRIDDGLGLVRPPANHEASDDSSQHLLHRPNAGTMYERSLNGDLNRADPAGSNAVRRTEKSGT